LKAKGFVSVVVLACISLFTLHPLAAQEEEVLLIVKEGAYADLGFMLENEVGVMAKMLKEAGLGVVVATPSGDPLVAGEATLTPDLALADANMGDYAGLIMPCMALTDGEPDLPEAQRLIKEAVVSGKPVAAQLGSVVTLARAGVLEGKKFAFTEEFLPTAPALEGYEFGGQGVVDDGNIVTSGVCPFAAQETGLEDTTPALTKALIAKINGS
jgi:putative intracellular protease/amidase